MQSQQHSRAQTSLLISKLLECRDNVSPFNLILDSVEQSSKPLLRHFIARKTKSTKVIFVSFETLRPWRNVNNFVEANGLGPAELQKRIQSYTKPDQSEPTTKFLLVVDTIHPLLNLSVNIASFLTSLITPNLTLLVVYHCDLPLPLENDRYSSYAPSPIKLLHYTCTAILTLHSLHHFLAERAAGDRSLPAPNFGLREEEEGLLQGIGSNDPRGSVVKLEVRRRSGRNIDCWFVLDTSSANQTRTTANENKRIPHKSMNGQSSVFLLDEHPLLRRSEPEQNGTAKEGHEVTFNLSLTEKQRHDRESVVLPYFDAQKEEGVGQGGRILYDMGSEDDFDEEEDEI